MPSIKISVPHSLPPDEATGRIKKLVGEVRNQFSDQVKNVRENWSGNTGQFAFEVMGLSVSGNVMVETREVRIEGTIPFAALPFKGRIESAIREKAKSLLA